ncbi:AarF/UbiB family protein, partial [Burkholderia pseudomallei]
EFFQAMSLELDYILEANNTLKSRENLKNLPDVYVPQVFLDLCTHKVLTLERLEGLKVDDRAGLDAAAIDRHSLAETAARAFLK